MSDYFPRYLKSEIEIALSDTPVVCLLGPRQVGKTTLVKEFGQQREYITFDDTALLNMAKADPGGFVQSLPEYVTLDEVQRIPELLLEIKAEVDRNRKNGRFLLTGSANLLLLPSAQDSLAGRMEVIYLQPLSEQEKQGGQDSLLERLVKRRITPQIKGGAAEIDEVISAVVSGGYPVALTREGRRVKAWYQQYLNAVIQRDVKDIAHIREGDELETLLKLLALRTGNLLNVNNIANDLNISRQTVDKYLTILERLFLVRRLPAWHKNGANRLIKAAKLHVIDSGIACYLSDQSKEQWNDPNGRFGALVESFVVQQLICQAGWVDPELKFSHYRDKDQVEVDLVIEQGNKVWGVEVKKATSIQAKDGTGLRRLAEVAGQAWQGGMILYSGNSCLALNVAENSFAVPINWLWK
ncbi:ATP-binding protein [Pasteurella testudinis]|uniref:ATP-binding protein n=1 Tax=Pasteurella testudinis TaxID=761 RepID=UPI004059E4BB